MNHSKRCPDCGAPILEGEGICPKCLLMRALGDSNAGREECAVTQAADSSAAAGSESKLHYFGDYELLEEIARGGMGVVYKARQLNLNRVVAVKMILAGQLASEMEVKRFQTEAEAAANLQHPNIVSIHEIGEHEGRQYFSMDFVEGKNLSEWARERRLSGAESAALVKTIAEAIHYAHQRGTLHRDLKPQNILIDLEGQPRITDFGLAKLGKQDSGMTRTGDVMGSPSYMPPEQAAGRHDRIGPASDVYSVGAILYQLLTNRAPFSAETPLATMQKVLNEDPIPPMKLDGNVPPDLQTICLKCLEKAPEKRYSSARDLAEELNRFLSHEPIHARPASAGRKLWAWSVRNPWAICGAGTLLLLAALGVAYGLWERLRFAEWKQVPGAPLPKPSPWHGNFLVVSLLLGIAAAFEAACLNYIRRRKNRPATTPHLALGWIAGLSWVAYGLALVRLCVYSAVWEPQRQAGAGPAFKVLVSATFAWIGALYLWHVIRDQQVLQFGWTGKAARKVRTIEVLNRKTVNTVGLACLAGFAFLSWLAIDPADYEQLLKSHHGADFGLVRNCYLLAAACGWLWTWQATGFRWFRPQFGILALVCISTALVLWMCLGLIGPLGTLQGMLAGCLGGLIQKRVAKVRISFEPERSAPPDHQLDSLFELIDWNERTVTWIIGVMLLLVLTICTGPHSAIAPNLDHYLFVGVLSLTCVPLLVAWRNARPEARQGPLALAVLMTAGSLAITLNLVFVTKELALGVAFGALFAGYTAGGALVFAAKFWKKALAARL